MDLSLQPEQIRWIIETLLILILSIACHEFGHANVADRLGDRLPRSQGRVTLNPIAHADPIGTLLMPGLALVLTKGASIGFGWGRPVMVNPLSFSRRFRMRTAHMMVAAAGPAMNLVLAVLLSVILAVLIHAGTVAPLGDVSMVITHAVSINLVLMFFNLIPAGPLDGAKVLEGLLPDSAIPTYQQISVYGLFIAMAFVMIPQLHPVFVKPALWVQTNLGSLLGIEHWRWVW